MTAANAAVAPTASEGILLYLCLNDRGGAELSMIKIAEGLRQRGRTVTLAVYGLKPELALELGFKGLVIDLKAQRSLFSVLPLRKVLQEGQYQTLITALTHTNILASLTALISGRKIQVLLSEHGVDGVTACETSFLFRTLTKFFYSKVSALVTVSEGLKGAWRTILGRGRPIVTIYNPVVSEIIEALPSPAHPWLATKEAPVIFGAGRLKPEKNFGLLLRAFAEVTKHVDARLVILGEGECQKELEHLADELEIRDKLLLPGFVTHPEGWLGYGDLFVSPSRREGFGNAIVEAMALGVPVVATDCPYGPAEILDQGRFGQLVPMDDVKHLAQAMQEGLASESNKEQIIERARQFSETRCIDLYVKLIDNPRS